MAASIPVLSSQPKTKDPPNIIKEPVRVGYYDILNTVGKGNFAVVKLATNIITKSKVAIKMINKDKAGEGSMEKIQREISIMRTLIHPNIIRLYQVMETEKMIYLVLEYASGGEIYDKLKSKGKMSECEARSKFKQIVAAVACCHSRCIVHRDLKIENLLLDAHDNIKLADFGFSKQFTPGSLLSTHCGSLPYAAPELFEGTDYDGPKVDIWSMGVILYTMVVGSLPFDAVNPVSLQKIILTGKIRVPYFMSTECENLIGSMLKINPAKRATLNEVLKHQWMVKAGADPGFVQLMEVSMGRGEGHEGEMDAEVLKHMESLSIDVQQTTKSVKEKKLNYHSAIYHLLSKQYSTNQKFPQTISPTHLPPVVRTHRRSSITTGVVSEVEVPLEPPPTLHAIHPQTHEAGGNAGLMMEGGHGGIMVDEMLVGEGDRMVLSGDRVMLMEGDGSEDMVGDGDGSMLVGDEGAEGRSGDGAVLGTDSVLTMGEGGGEDPPMEMVARYCTMRRHTIGMADHEEASRGRSDFGLGISGWHKLFERVAAASTAVPEANDPATTPIGTLPTLSPQYFLPFSTPSNTTQQLPQHLSNILNNPQQLLQLLQCSDNYDNNHLKPPQLLPPGSYGRRASDGGANIMPVQIHGECMALPPLHHPHIGRLKKEREGRSSERSLEREAIERYMRSRGYLKRYTLAMTTPTHELSEDTQRKLANNPIKSCQSHLTRERTPHRDSLKDTSKLHLPSDRFSPVRRSSDGITLNNKFRHQLERSYSPETLRIDTSDSLQSSLSRLRHEHQQLQKRFPSPKSEDAREANSNLHNNLSVQNSPRISPTPSPPNPPSHPPSPITVPPTQESCLYKHLQTLQLQQQQHNSNISNVPCACSSCGSPTSQLSHLSPSHPSTATDQTIPSTTSFIDSTFTQPQQQQAPQPFFIDSTFTQPQQQQAPQPFFFQLPQPAQFYDTSLLQISNLDSIREDDDTIQANPDSATQHPSTHHSSPRHASNHLPSTHDAPTPIDPISFLQQTAQDYLMKQQQLHIQNQQQQQQLLEALHRQQQFILRQELMQQISPHTHQSTLQSKPSTHLNPPSHHLPRISITDHLGHIIDPSSFSSSSDIDMLQDATTLPTIRHSPQRQQIPTHNADQACDSSHFDLSYDQALRSALPLNRFLDNNMLLSNQILDANVATKSSK